MASAMSVWDFDFYNNQAAFPDTRTGVMAGYRGYDVSYKVLLVGDSGVGKTALIRSLMGRGFSSNHLATVGIDFVKKIFHVDGARIQLEIWDTAGQERFRTITRFQYRGTKGLLLVYDVTDKASFAMLNYWLESIDKELDGSNKEPIPVYIIGNKCDLQDARKISKDMGKKISDSSYVHGFMETSAKHSHNVERAFSSLAQAVAEVFNPKVLNSYLSPHERKERELRKMGQMTIFSQAPQLPKNTSKIKLGIETGKEKIKCACN